MNLKALVLKLDKDFDVAHVKDEWQWLFDDLFIKKSQKKFRKPMHHTGLVFKNSEEINKIYTAFSPSTFVLEEIKRRTIKDCLLVVKHPFDWDGREQGEGFIPLSQKDYDLMEEMRVSLYSLHTPMDKNRNDKVVSTAYALAKVIKMNVEDEFAVEGERNPTLLIGLIGEVKEKSFNLLVDRLNSILHYNVKTMRVNEIVGKVAIVTGGGFIPTLMREAKERGCNTYITGIITSNSSEYSQKNYPLELKEVQKVGINVIGASHYLTEKWAMEFSLSYFEQFCPADFIEDLSALKKLE
jgi:putative NIF3 family GTP cyclohydrolase 1 type 2